MKNCVVILTRSDLPTLRELKTSLDRLYTNYVNEFPCDVVVFHERDFSSTFKEQALKRFRNLKFKEITFKAPDFLTPENLNFKDPGKDLPFLGMSYRNMCRFYTLEFFNHLKEYDWYWRLDVDSILPSKISFNIFDYLTNNNKVYGYVAELPEHPPFVKGLGDYIKKYIKDNKIKPKFLDFLFDNGEYNCRQIYNNFEICNLNIFRRDGVLEFLDSIDRSGKIYEYRWGDAPIRTLMLSMFVEREKIHRFTDIDYKHQGFKQEGGVIECEYTPKDWITNSNFIA